MARFPVPKCENVVAMFDSMATSLDLRTRKWKLTAFCHGEKDVMYFDDADDESEIMQAVAFRGRDAT